MSLSSSAGVGDDSVEVKMLMAPINPADINQIEGSYAFIPPRPFVAGNEGLGEVVAVGPGVKALHPGDWVIPAVAGLGTWREALVCPERSLMSVPKDIPMEAAATILVNPCTAYRMLADFVPLQPGDCVIQNGANSAVGRAVIEIAAQRGIKTVNIVRDRPKFEALENELRQLGATMVVKAECLPLPETLEHIVKVVGKKPALALNCVGGVSASDLARSLGPGGTLVTYGGMSRKPVTIPTGLLIFNDLRFTGFWVSAWYKRQHELALQGDMSLIRQRAEMMDELFAMIREGKLTMPPTRTHELSAWKEAIELATSPYTGCKELFKF
jgi:trans-2-enoyl-CoA reductase